MIDLLDITLVAPPFGFPPAPGPGGHCVEGMVFVPGAQAGMAFVPGAQEGIAFVPGAQQGKVVS